jgi:hypothetical protein
MIMIILAKILLGHDLIIVSNKRLENTYARLSKENNQDLLIFEQGN